ncbi:radical SAM/SPASM domain-containing protein [Leptolyngbya iicbica]|uniref:Radical SAM/SPASM domain-containing protein n=2 Tax=Cyanophyceae TaxID=3028117 RepID=A0A4V2E224_9CYAN|nr:radical SAM/SPASM domain-containing protein [Leptolyngbya sp. LK]RZM76556.1 radical SAM/SPASM domain-containing protein [Leptolyngbya sp. LK]
MRQLDRLHIEVTNVCNFKCEFCPDAIMARRRGHMSFELLEKVLTEVAEQQLARIITFHLMGEPFIYPHIFEGIHSAVTKSLQLHLTTNGSTFHLFPEQIEQLVRSRVPKVTISLQTPDPHTFQLRGAPPRLASDAYFEGIVNYVQANLRSTTSPTRVHIKFLDTTPHPFLVPHKPLDIVAGKTQMVDELMTWAERLLSALPASEVDWDAIHRHLQRLRTGRWQLIPLHPKLVLETFPLDSWGNVEAGTVTPAQWGYCNGASQQAGVLYDGTVVPCCKDFEGQIPLGRVTEQPLADILTDRPACQLRQGFERLQVNHPVCQRCMGADTPLKSALRQVGSVAYFKAYSPVMRRMHKGWGEV